jgi:hypothetical protein
MAVETERVSKEDVFKAIVTSAAEFYKFAITVASAFLGGSLIFVQNIAAAKTLTRGSLWFLGSGWALLIASIFLIGLVQRGNLKSGQYVMDGHLEKSRRLDQWTSTGTTLAMLCLALGILLVMLFGFFHLRAIAT